MKDNGLDFQLPQMDGAEEAVEAVEQVVSNATPSFLEDMSFFSADVVDAVDAGANAAEAGSGFLDGIMGLLKSLGDIN